MKLQVPFFPNTPDDTHCYQAVLQMIIGYFLPLETHTLQDLDSITGKMDEKWTWPTAGLLWLRSKGLRVRTIELFSNKSFVDFGEQYLREYYGEAVAREQIAHSAISIERERLRLAGDELDQEVRIPELRDIYAALDTNSLVMCTINACVLAGTEGYVGHFVLVVGYENESIIVHDPGLPGMAYREVSTDLFERAWGYPDTKAKSATVISR